METIRVNMTPCEDVQTIHASQNDNEAREWGFELHNNGEKIDSSSISDQLVFKAYKGGTEQLLPENTSTPTTSPFKGDIRYPQGLLADQEFTYRQSPSESDGLAKITDIKGNTIVWNQQMPISSVASYSGAGITANNSNDGSYVINGTATNVNINYWLLGEYAMSDNVVFALKKDHKYLTKSVVFFGTQSNTGVLSPSINNVLEKWSLFTVNNADYLSRAIRMANLENGKTYSNYKVYPMIIDLTQMGLDSISSASEFTSLFPLPFYQFEQGKLLSFNGNGIKTVSKNQFDTQVITTSYQGLTLTKTQGTIRANYSGGSQYAGFNFYGRPVFTDTFLKGRYRFSFDVNGLDTQWTVGLRQGATFIGGQALAISNDGHYSFAIDAEANPNCYLSFARTGNKTTAYDVTFSNIQLELGTTETSYTPFEEQTISLPISQYFPDGMDGINDARDYINETSYGKVMGEVDLGTISYGVSSESLFYTESLIGIIKPANWTAEIVNAICPLYRASYGNLVYSKVSQAQYCMGADGNGRMYFYDPSKSSMTAEQFKMAMNGVKLKFELKTPLENYGVVDLGSLTWEYQSNYQRFRTSLTDAKQPSTSNLLGNIVCPLYVNVSMNTHTTITDMTMALGAVGYDYLYVRNLAYTDPSVFKQAMQGVYLLYEKENPQGFTTASLVTENAEIPLSNNDGTLIGKCTEELSAEPGFHDAKIKLSDSDGTCYSNKLQLHVERKPS